MSKTIQWLVNLERGKLVVAMLIIATVSLFFQNQVKEKEKTVLQEDFRKELLRRADSCESQKVQLIKETNFRIEVILKSQLDRAQRTQREIDSLINYNSRMIRRNIREINKRRSAYYRN